MFLIVIVFRACGNLNGLLCSTLHFTRFDLIYKAPGDPFPFFPKKSWWNLGFGDLLTPSSMDDLTSYYAPPIHHPYYQPTPPPPPGTSHQPPSVVSHPIHVQPQFVTYASPLYPQSSHDQLRTLFVAGLPEDVKPREIYNLFREFPGYQSSNLRAPISSNSQVCTTSIWIYAS